MTENNFQIELEPKIMAALINNNVIKLSREGIKMGNEKLNYILYKMDNEKLNYILSLGLEVFEQRTGQGYGENNG